MALFHFTQLLAKQPTNWNALVRLVEVMRRTGNLEDLPEYLNNAENMCENPLKEGGLLYSKALYQWYAGNLNSALRNFNITRQDLDWGLDSIYNMIEICLNPEDDMLTDQLMDNDDLEYRDSRSMALKTGRSFKNIFISFYFWISKNYCLIFFNKMNTAYDLVFPQLIAY